MKQYCEFMRHNSFVVLFVSKHKGNLFKIDPILLKRKLGRHALPEMFHYAVQHVYSGASVQNIAYLQIH